MINRLREIRRIHDLTQQDLAERVGVTRQTIHSIETEKFLPSVKLAFMLAGVFGTSVEHIFMLKEKSPFETNEKE